MRICISVYIKNLGAEEQRIRISGAKGLGV